MKGKRTHGPLQHIAQSLDNDYLPSVFVQETVWYEILLNQNQDTPRLIQPHRGSLHFTSHYVALLICISISHVQQQERAVGVRPVFQTRFRFLQDILSQVQLTYTTDHTGENKKQKNELLLTSKASAAHSSWYVSVVTSTVWKMIQHGSNELPSGHWKAHQLNSLFEVLCALKS